MLTATIRAGSKRAAVGVKSGSGSRATAAAAYTSRSIARRHTARRSIHAQSLIAHAPNKSTFTGAPLPTASSHHHASTTDPALPPHSHHASASATPPVATSSSFRSSARNLYARFTSLVHHYKLGAKLLWKNLKRARTIRKRLSAGSLATHSEHVHMRRFRADMLVGVPFVLVGALPVVGYAAPIFAFFAPRYIPATFHTPEQVLQFIRFDARAARTTLESLRQAYSFHADACGLDKMRGLLERVERGVGRVERLGDLLPLASLFQQLTPTPLQYSRTHLLQLQRTLVHSDFIPKYLYTKSMVASSLIAWREQIWVEDQLLLRGGGVQDLSIPELVEALYDRGLYRQPIAMGAVLAREQRDQLDSVDKKKQSAAAPTSSSSATAAVAMPISGVLGLPPLPPPPSDALIKEWRSVLQEWVQLHIQLKVQADERQQQKKIKEAHTIDENSSSQTLATEVVTPATVATSSSSSSFPLSFLLHVGPLARTPSTPADVAAVQPPPYA